MNHNTSICRRAIRSVLTASRDALQKLGSRDWWRRVDSGRCWFIFVILIWSRVELIRLASAQVTSWIILIWCWLIVAFEGRWVSCQFPVFRVQWEAVSRSVLVQRRLLNINVVRLFGVFRSLIHTLNRCAQTAKLWHC